MARLLAVLPCEKIIVDREGIPSLIALFQQVHAAPAGTRADGTIAPIAPNTITTKEWAVFSEWKPEPDDVGKQVKQVLELQYPDGTVSPVRGKVSFTFINEMPHRNQQNIVGFPIGQQGTYLLRVWLEKDGNRISDVTSYEMGVSHSIPAGHRVTPTPST